MKFFFSNRHEEIELNDETKREVQGKRVVIDKTTGKAKEVDIYDRPEPAKKKAGPERQRANLSSNLEQSLIPADVSKYQESGTSVCIEANLEVPDEEFEIEYVYGYRTFDCN